jgi:beta-phosphoglucomutase-like phosphatase (HAD superfamily)
LKKLSISQYFKSMITAEDASTGKPSPVPYLLGARAIGLDPSSCVVIEDSVNGVLAGKAAGSIVIAVPSTGADLAAMKSADHVVSSLEGALEILTKMGL